MRYHFGRPLGENFSCKEILRFQFNCTGIEGEMRHNAVSVHAVMVQGQSSPIGYICPRCGVCWSTRRGDRLQMPVVHDPIDIPEEAEVNIGAAGRRYLERKRLGHWPGGQPL